MIHRVHRTSGNYTTYKRKIFCNECGKLVTHEGVIDLIENGNGPDRWTATYHCERQSCQKDHPNYICKYTETRPDARPPIMDRGAFERSVKKKDILERFTVDD